MAPAWGGGSGPRWDGSRLRALSCEPHTVARAWMAQPYVPSVANWTLKSCVDALGDIATLNTAVSNWTFEASTWLHASVAALCLSTRSEHTTALFDTTNRIDTGKLVWTACSTRMLKSYTVFLNLLPVSVSLGSKEIVIGFPETVLVGVRTLLRYSTAATTIPAVAKIAAIAGHVRRAALDGRTVRRAFSREAASSVRDRISHWPAAGGFVADVVAAVVGTDSDGSLRLEDNPPRNQFVLFLLVPPRSRIFTGPRLGPRLLQPGIFSTIALALRDPWRIQKTGNRMDRSVALVEVGYGEDARDDAAN